MTTSYSNCYILWPRLKLLIDDHVILPHSGNPDILWATFWPLHCLHYTIDLWKLTLNIRLWYHLDLSQSLHHTCIQYIWMLWHRMLPKTSVPSGTLSTAHPISGSTAGILHLFLFTSQCQHLCCIQHTSLWSILRKKPRASTWTPLYLLPHLTKDTMTST